MRSRAQGGLLVVVMGAAALLLGLMLVGNPAFVIPLFIESLLLLLLTLALLRRERNDEERQWITRILLVALAVRAGIISVVYGALSPMLFAPDTASYYAQGLSIERYWSGVGPKPDIVGSWQATYAYLNAWGIRLFGDPTWAMVVLNTFASLWTVVITYFLARRCFGVPAARIAAILVAVFPSTVLWSVLNIRDPLTTFLVTFLVFLAVRAYGRPRFTDLLLFGAGAVALSTLRDYMGFLVMAGVLLGLAASLRPGRIISTLVMGSAVVLALMFTLEQAGIFGPEFLESPFASTAVLRRGLQSDFTSGLAGSAFGVGVEINGLGDAIRYLPMGLAFFLFAPFPWAVSSLLQAVTLPEVLLWYALVPFLLSGLATSRRRDHRMALLVVGVLFLTVTSYALVEGNFGTAYRHRTQVMPLFFVFVGQGLAVWWRRRRAAQRVRQDRRVHARVQVLAPRVRRR